MPSKSGLSLSERIAALQRKTSNPTAPSDYTGASASNNANSASSAERPRGTLSRNGSSSSGVQGLRDRMAKFQSSDEKPVMPRSSFGSPAPNPEISHARRQFPGASAGKGSGAWGEGVLRPQMTGGVWLGAGAGGGWGDPSSASLRPHMTGTGAIGHANAATQVPRSHRGASDSILHGSGRDAFADLDDETNTTADEHVETKSDASEPPSPADNILPTLPDTPTTEIDTTKLNTAATIPESIPEASLPDFPTAPLQAPEIPTAIPNGLVRPDAAADTSVEIGVQARSPGELEKIRQRAEDLELTDQAGTAADEPWIVPASNDLEGSVPEPLDISVIERVKRSGSASVDEQEPWVQGYGAPSAVQDMASAEAAAESAASQAQHSDSITAEYNAAGTLPQRAQVARTDSGRVDPNDPAAHQIQGPGLLVPRDEIAEARAHNADTAEEPRVDPSSHEPEEAIEPSADLSTSIDIDKDTSNMMRPAMPGPNKSLAPIGRTPSQSQRLRRPPPGTVLSAADLDASDDEYEPGWASVTSVMSSSRP